MFEWPEKEKKRQIETLDRAVFGDWFNNLRDLFSPNSSNPEKIEAVYYEKLKYYVIEELKKCMYILEQRHSKYKSLPSPIQIISAIKNCNYDPFDKKYTADELSEMIKNDPKAKKIDVLVKAAAAVWYSIPKNREKAVQFLQAAKVENPEQFLPPLCENIKDQRDLYRANKEKLKMVQENYNSECAQRLREGMILKK